MRPAHETIQIQRLNILFSLNLEKWFFFCNHFAETFFNLKLKQGSEVCMEGRRGNEMKYDCKTE